MADKNLDRQIKSYIRKLRNISQIEVPRANAAAINGIAKRSRTRIIAGVSKQTRIPQKDIRRKTYLSRATARKPTAKLTGYVKPVSAVRLLTKNQVAKKIGTGTNKQGVKAKGYNWPGAFLQRGAGANVHVFQRSSSSRYPIRVVTVDVTKPFQNTLGVVPKRLMKSDYKRLLEQELKFRLSKYNAR